VEIVSNTFSVGFHFRGDRRLGDAGEVVPLGFVPQEKPILSITAEFCCCGFVAIAFALDGLLPLVDRLDGGFGL